mgnify:CR=1 FL=1
MQGEIPAQKYPEYHKKFQRNSGTPGIFYEKNIDLLHSQQDNNDSQRSRSEYHSLKKHEDDGILV